MISDDFLWLQTWYKEHCNGDWEHQWGIDIRNTDNAGWLVTIDLIDTELEDKEFTEIKNDLSEQDWYSCRVISGKFEGRGCPTNLCEILKIFRKWAES